MISKWDAQEALRLIEAERVTLFSSVPALVKDLLTQPNLADFDISSLPRFFGWRCNAFGSAVHYRGEN